MIVKDIIYIEAQPDEVWAVTEDVERWPEWTPTITSAIRLDDGPFRIGSTVKIKQPLQPVSEWIVTEFVPEERFAWETKRRGLQMRASHEVNMDGPGTMNTLRVEASGVIATLLSPILRTLIRRALLEENRGLKALCEKK